MNLSVLTPRPRSRLLASTHKVALHEHNEFNYPRVANIEHLSHFGFCDMPTLPARGIGILLLTLAPSPVFSTTHATEPTNRAPPPQPSIAAPAIAPNILSDVAARLIAAEIPRTYEGTKDWGRTTQIVSGLHSYGNFFKFDIHRQRTTVNDGLWKRYRLTLVDPDNNLHVEIQNLRTLDSGRIALTLEIAAKLHGWARLKLYERGVHIIALEAEGDSGIRLALDANIGLTKLQSDSFLPKYALDPTVTDVRVKFDDFRLTRISDVRGTLAHEIGILLREAAEDELKGPQLAAKINKSINKHRNRLQLSPDALLGKAPDRPKNR